MYTKEDVFDFVAEENVKFIRLTYFDVFGLQKNIAIQPSELKKAFGPGIVIDAGAAAGFANDVHGDLYLRPDPSTFTVLPWRSSDGAVIFMVCDIYYPDGRIFGGDTRYILKQAIRKARETGLLIDVGTEFEFYLFHQDKNSINSHVPLDRGGYMDVAPFDRGEDMRRDICMTLEEMGLRPQASFHQEGPGQNEIDFHSAPALIAADDAAIFKWVVRTTADMNGLVADFSPKPMEGQPGNCMHMTLKLEPLGECDLPAMHEAFAAGILAHLKELTVFMNPTLESYKRLGKKKAPLYLTWSTKNRFQLLRIPSNAADRIEVRSPDPLANPYLVIALLIYAGVDGIEKGMKLPAPCDISLSALQKETGYDSLPESLEKARALARNSAVVKEWLPESVIAAYME